MSAAPECICPPYRIVGAGDVEPLPQGTDLGCKHCHPDDGITDEVFEKALIAAGHTMLYGNFKAQVRAALVAALPHPPAISGADIKPGMTILLAPGGKPFRVDGVEPFNKSENVFVLTSGVPHSETGKFAYGDRWYCLLGGGS